MTLEEINESLGDNWFGSTADTGRLEPGTYIAYNDENDVQVINVKDIFKAQHCGDHLELYEDVREGTRVIPVIILNLSEDEEADDYIVHWLNKWQARGAWAFTIE